MGDYGSNAALGFIEGTIIGDGIDRVLQARRQGHALRQLQDADELERINLHNKWAAERNARIDLQVANLDLDTKLGFKEAEIAKRDHEIALRDHEIALRNHEIAKRDHEIALLTQKLHDTEWKVIQVRKSRETIERMRSNLLYAFEHYRRLLKIDEKGGDAYDFAWDSGWSPSQVPPDQRSD